MAGQQAGDGQGLGMARLREAFSLFDKDKDGEISSTEIAKVGKCNFDFKHLQYSQLFQYSLQSLKTAQVMKIHGFQPSEEILNVMIRSELEQDENILNIIHGLKG